MPQATNDPFAIESPVYWVVGMSKKLTLRIPGASTISGQSVSIYKDTEDTSADNLSGAAATNGVDTITTPTIQSLQGGEVYFLNFSATVNGKGEVYLCEIRVLHPWGAQS